MKKTPFFFFFINKATTMASNKYIPVHMRNKSSSFQSKNNKNFDEQFPDLLSNNFNVDAPALPQNTNSIATYNEISAMDVETKNVNKLPEGWKELTLDMRARKILEEPKWEQIKMQERYEEGLELLQYIQEKNEDFIDTFIKQHGINEYMRLYKCEFNYESDVESEEIDEYSDFESDGDY